MMNPLVYVVSPFFFSTVSARLLVFFSTTSQACAAFGNGLSENGMHGCNAVFCALLNGKKKCYLPPRRSTHREYANTHYGIQQYSVRNTPVLLMRTPVRPYDVLQYSICVLLCVSMTYCYAPYECSKRLSHTSSGTVYICQNSVPPSRRKPSRYETK